MNTRICIGLAVGIVVATGSSVRAQCCEGGGGPTEVGGLICQDTTWHCSGSPYIVVNSIIVGCGATLTIEPGVELRFKSNLGLTVGHITFGGGTLVGRGTTECPILFTSNAPYEGEPTEAAPGDWARIFFTDFATDAEYDEFGQYVSGSVLEHVIVEYSGGGEAAPVAITAENCSPYLAHCEVHQNQNRGIWVGSSGAGDVKIEHCVVHHNGSTGIVVVATGGGAVEIEDCQVHDLQTGRGIVVTAGAFPARIENCHIARCTVDAHGAGIFLVGGADHIVSGNVVEDCTATSSASQIDRHGGGMYVNARTTLDGNTVIGNRAIATGWQGDAFGGGIFLDTRGDGSTLSNNVVTGNSADSYNAARGGGIGVWNSPSCVLSSNTVKGNIVDGLGGGIYLFGSGNSTFLTGNTVTDNSTTGQWSYGGGIYLEESWGSVLSENLVADNSTRGQDATGGGIMLNNSGSIESQECQLKDNIVTGNSTSGQNAGGGGIRLHNSWNCSLTGNTVTDNVTTGNSADGGGVLVVGGGITTLESNNITNNTSGDQGGGILFWNSGRWALVSNVITDNTAVGNAGGIYIGNSGCAQTDPDPQCTMTDTIVARNHTNGDTGGIYVRNSPWVSFAGDPETCIYNCICDNDGYCVYNDTAFDDAGSGDIDARHVIWCTDEMQPIQDCIYDFFDDANKGIVVSFPFVAGDCENWEWHAWRDLSAPELAYRPEVPKVISIQISPPVDAATITMEDKPPMGWAVSNISNGGFWDPDTQKVKWGPFDPPFPTEVQYTVTPPVDADGEVCFAGTISIDGGNLGICGNRCIEPPSCPYHPADEQPEDVCADCGDCGCATCSDGRIEACEISGYACAWKRGCHDEGGLVSRAGFLWWNGECYCWDETTEPPTWWPRSCDEPDGCCAMPGTNDAGGQTVDAREFLNAAGSVRTKRAQVRVDTGSDTPRGFTLDAARPGQAPAARHWSAVAQSDSVGSPATRGLPGPFCPQSPFTVWVRLNIPPGSSAVTLEDRSPDGWIATEWSDGCDWDAINGKVKCGPYFEPFPEEIRYAVASPLYGGGTCFEGTIWLDGIPYSIEGEECVIVDLDDFVAWPGCMTGPGGGPYNSGCEPLDCESDLDVDLKDFAAFQRIFSMP